MNDSIKQNIQWFPGHMAKTRRLITEQLSLVDAVTEIVDARVPMSSRNPELGEIIARKPRIVLLNKCDVADEAVTRQWIAYYKQQGVAALAVDCRSGKGVNQYLPLVQQVLAEKIKKNQDKGMGGRALRMMVVGIPNSGKSSFINRMAGRSRAKVADKPGVTRHNQWFVIGGGVELLDTPGVLWPKFEDAKVGFRLAFTGAVKDEVVDVETLAMHLVEALLEVKPSCLNERYKIEQYEELPPWDVVELIGRRRGFLISGGEIDTERTSIMLLDEFRAGKLGRISFDLPPQ